MEGFSIGYTNFTVLLMLLTGGLLLFRDVKMYELKGMQKEQKATKRLGWLNITAGAILWTGNWAYQNLFFF